MRGWTACATGWMPAGCCDAGALRVRVRACFRVVSPANRRLPKRKAATDDDRRRHRPPHASAMAPIALAGFAPPLPAALRGARAPARAGAVKTPGLLTSAVSRDEAAKEPKPRRDAAAASVARAARGERSASARRGVAGVAASAPHASAASAATPAPARAGVGSTGWELLAAAEAQPGALRRGGAPAASLAGARCEPGLYEAAREPHPRSRTPACAFSQRCWRRRAARCSCARRARARRRRWPRCCRRVLSPHLYGSLVLAPVRAARPLTRPRRARRSRAGCTSPRPTTQRPAARA
jgi:hypothetical protein